MQLERKSLCARMSLGHHSITHSMIYCRNAPTAKTWKRLFLVFADVMKLPIEAFIPASLLIDNEDLSEIYFFAVFNGEIPKFIRELSLELFNLVQPVPVKALHLAKRVTATLKSWHLRKRGVQT